MPRKYARRRRPRKNIRKRRYIRRKKNTSTFALVKNPTIVPDRLATKIKYATQFSLIDGTGGLTTSYVFRGNSAYDPDYTGVGSQPVGYDEWSAFYGKYKVNASSIRLVFMSQSNSSPTANIMLSCTPTIDLTVTDPVQLSLNPYTRTRFIATANGNAGVVHIKNYMASKKVFGDKTANDEDYEATISGNPFNQWFWKILAQSVDQSSTINVQVFATITYYIEFSDRRQLNFS